MTENSILKSVKKVLGMAPEYTAFDEDVLMHINTAFSILQQRGVGPEEGFDIQDDSTVWSDYTNNVKQLNMVKTYMYVRVRLVFDPPTTSFAIDAMQKQVDELEWRLQAIREDLLENG